ncbi:MAG: radical SAM protein, partial [Ignavibacteriaceae bacterium]
MSNKNKVSVITLGCSKNIVDSERLMKQLQLNKVLLMEDPEDADTVIINTCGFIERAKEESINTILNAVSLKSKGKLNKVIVAGCLSQRYKEELAKDIPEVDVYFGTEDYEGIIKELGGELKYNLLGERLLTTPSHTAYLKISEGCDHPCSFCAIPLMRGQHKSKPMEDLIKETEFLANNGTKELIIIAQDTTDYGKDIYGKKSNYVDIPLQHISDNVLRSMRRGVTAAQTKKLLNRLRSSIPGLTLRTTLLTGYPNETEDDFKELCDFVGETRFDRIGTFTFSVEDNTSSYILGDPVHQKIKEERRDILMEIQKDISAELNSAFIGKKLRILVEAKEGDFYIGRSYRDAPEVDGEVLIPNKNNILTPGNFYDVRV